MNKPIECPYCGATSWRVNARDGIECSGCGAPEPSISLIKAAPIYVMNVPTHISDHQYVRIRAAWESAFKGDVPKLLILEEGISISPLA